MNINNNNKNKKMIGYKGFNSQLQGYNNFQFEEGKTYEITGELEMCKNGFHFCDMPLHVFTFYNNINDKYAIIEALGEIVVDISYKKLATNKIKISKVISYKEFIQLCKNAVFKVKTGNYYFDENSKYHRENDLPAIEDANGNKWWYQHGNLHRDNDLPDIEKANGNKWWYQHNELHRDNDLPVIEDAAGNKHWYKDGKLHRENDLPAVELADGSKVWYQHGKRHRENDLPAIEYLDGTKEWYQHGKLHRDNDLPAIEYADGSKAWYQHDILQLKIIK